MAAAFSDTDLRTIRRTFLTRKAAPDEVRLLLRPKARSWYTRRAAWVMPLTIILPMWQVARGAFTDTDRFKGLLINDFWAASCFLILLHVLIYVLLPGVWPPRFELILRPNDDDVVMRMLGFEQRRNKGFCRILDRRLWCTFTVDTIPYLLLRRWWQWPLPLGAGAAALARILAPSEVALRDSLLAGGSRAAIMDSSRRTLLVKAFGEAIVTAREVVLPLPAAIIWLVIGMVGGGAVGGTAAMMWEGYYGLWRCEYVPRLGSELPLAVCHVRAVPMWLPSLLAFLVTAIPILLSDPWLRRAFAVVPRGQGRLRIQVGGRVRGEYLFTDEHVGLADCRGVETVASHIYVRTKAWTGYQPASERHFDERAMAIYTLDAWANAEPLPSEDEPK